MAKRGRWLQTMALAAAGLAAAAVPEPALAWNERGHMCAAYVAYRRLNPGTRARVNALLKLHPRYPEWAARAARQAPAADQELLVFLIAATWADAIKQDPGYRRDGSQGGNRPEGSPDPGRNTGYDDLLMHKYWHFIDTPFSGDGAALPRIPAPNAQERIARFRAVLASQSPDALKSYDLVWLLHLVADVHQPLHAATRVSREHPDGDAGGNLVKLDGPRAGLHLFWDGLLGERSTFKSALRAARRLPEPDSALAAVGDEKAWIRESFEAARREVYAPPVDAGDGPFRLTAEYKQAAGRLAKERVALAGARLAGLLNAELR